MTINIQHKTTLIYKFIALTIVVLGLPACKSTEPQSTIEAPNIVGTLKESIQSNKQLAEDRAGRNNSANEELLSLSELDQLSLSLSEPIAAPEEKRFSISADDIDAAQFFQDLFESSDVNAVVDPEITGTITLHLKLVTIEETLIALRDVYGLDFERTSYGYHIMSDKLTSRIFNLNYLDVARSGTSDTGVSSGQISTDGKKASQVTTTQTSDFWKDLESTLKLIIGDKPGRSVVINSQSGIIVVKANPRELINIEKYLKRSEQSLQKQVIIEARILEVSLTDSYSAGINWNSFANDVIQGSTDSLAVQLQGDTLNGVPGLGGLFNINVNAGDFSSLVQLLSNQGEVKVLSSPRISTVNNQKAVIKVGTDDYFVTNIVNGGEESNNPEIVLTPFFSGIALDVTPQIGEENVVILHVRPSVTEVKEKTKIINIAGENFQLPLASSTIRETDSIIKARSGQIVIIGGLLQNKTDNNEAGVPILSRIPIIKNFFGQVQKGAVKSELVILLRSTVTNDQTWQDELSRSLDAFEQ